MKKHNVIILTTGLSGSSLFTKLLCKHGYWCGEKTITKNNYSGHYNTYENEVLVKLNQTLLDKCQVDFSVQDQFDDKLFAQIEKLSQTIDLKPYTAFIKECDNHQPWVWKDPRLIHTLGFWLKLIDRENCRFLYVARRPWWLWVSFLNKRRLIDYTTLKHYETQSLSKSINALKSWGGLVELFYFDDLISNPKTSLGRLNRFLRISISLEDFKQNSHSTPTFEHKAQIQIKAILIYLKNYQQVPR